MSPSTPVPYAPPRRRESGRRHVSGALSDCPMDGGKAHVVFRRENRDCQKSRPNAPNGLPHIYDDWFGPQGRHSAKRAVGPPARTMKPVETRVFTPRLVDEDDKVRSDVSSSYPPRRFVHCFAVSENPNWASRDERHDASASDHDIRCQSPEAPTYVSHTHERTFTRYFGR